VDLAEVELLENRLDVGQQHDTNRLFAHRRDRLCSQGPDPLRPLATRRIGNSKKRSPVIGGTARQGFQAPQARRPSTTSNYR
jgi:hypothetical protein